MYVPKEPGRYKPKTLSNFIQQPLLNPQTV